MPRLPEVNRDNLEKDRPRISTELARTVSDRVRVDWPAPRGAWSDETIDSYYAFQQDVTAQAVRGVDVAAVMRYFDLLELQSRIFEKLIDEPLTETNDAGTKSHPLIASLAQIVRTSLSLAQHIGATPMSRVKLGLVNAEGALLQKALEAELGGALEETAPHLIERDVAREVPSDETVDAEIVEEW